MIEDIAVEAQRDHLLGVRDRWLGRRKLDRFEVQPQVGQIEIAVLGAAIQKRMILAGKVPIGR